jgi:peptidoglycan/xylan/chitin deacetylase (PgdA/CDA1 family)
MRLLTAVSLVVGLLTFSMPASAAGPVVVSLTFDDNTISQYNLGYLQALKPHNAHATLFVKSGSVGTGGSNMSWAQVTTLAGDGNDIGGKTVNATNLTTDPNPSAQVCQDRQNLITHGLDPISFAYPGGANNVTVRDIVKNCGYGNGRTAAGLSVGTLTTGTSAETLPPANWFATRAYAPGTVTAANMQSIVTNAASKGGGWIQIVLPAKVCPTQTDPSYSTCISTGSYVTLDDLNSFLTWTENAGQAGGAPVGTTIDTVAHVVTGADNVAPSTAISCNDAPCSTDPYAGSVTVKLSATDSGSGVSSTRYTTDGSDPTLSSSPYTGPFGVNGSGTSTIVKFRSWDRANNAEAIQTQVIQAPPDSAAPSTTISCNGAACTGAPYVDSVSVTLSAIDTGGSGVDKTYFTTDGSTPDTSSTVYAGAFQLSEPGTYDVKFFTTDNADNVELAQSQVIQVVPHATIVSLTFDNSTVGQYTLGFQQALQPHNAHATFFVNSGNVGVSAQIMTWSQLAALAAAGNDIGGKTVGSTNLTTDPDPAAQVCDDRKALIGHGLNPIAFAYPGGAFNQAVKDIVKSCGYGNARSAGSLSPSGPTYAETLPPKDWFATRAYAAGTSGVTLTNMESLVSGAASGSGGWVQIVIGRVCSQALDPSNYSTCSAGSGHIELADLTAFLDWIQDAGQAGGAPAGTVIEPVRDVLIAADDMAPTTAITCDVGPCSDPYNSVIRVMLSASDVGSSVAATHYTTDGSEPTQSSPTFTKPIPITSPTTLKFRSWDYAGNGEATQSRSLQATPPPDTTAPTTTIACNGAPCVASGYDGSVTVSLAADDGTGWGLDATYYTTDGSLPDQTSAVYSGSFQLSQAGSYAVRFFSTDLAGNAEAVQTQGIQVLPPKTVVSLTFDDGLLSQYRVGFLRGLKPHGTNGTFFITTGATLGGDPEHMTWAEMTALNNGGNEIAGHTLDHIDLKAEPDQQIKIHQVCDDRQTLVDHGFDPVSFAYPFGAYDSTAESIVQQCGYTSGRAAGGVDVAGEGAGPVYAESIPPKDPFATRTVYDGSGGAPLTLAHMETAVNAASQHGGGWIQINFHQICSQTYDPDNYSFCVGDYGPVELDTLNQFLDWLQNAGQPGGAPTRTVVQTVSQVIDGPDTQAPVTSLLCDDAPCQASTYHGSVTVSLSATDPGGSGVEATYFTTDGSMPDQNGQAFSRPFTITAPTTVKFFSADNAGNVEALQLKQVLVQPNADPVIAAAGDIACDPTAPAFNEGQGTEADCRAAHTAKLLNGVDAVLPLGDNQYECGGPEAYAQSYDPTWGVKKPISYPVPGDKDIATSGGTDCPTTPGAGYYQYFGSRAGDPSKGYYSYDLGTWHIVALNSAPCPEDASFCAAGSAQEQWLKNDLAASSTSCTLAYFQNPRFGSTASGGSTIYAPFWSDLYAAGVEVVLNGDDHWYERFQPLNPSGNVDLASGIREFIVGTGGAGLDTPSTQLPTSVVLNDTTHGVLRMTLKATGYEWSFVPDEGTFTDSGSASCHAAPDTIAPTTTIACNGATCLGTYEGTVSVSLAATDAGGSGVNKTYFTTDGTTPTTSSTLYTGPFPLFQSRTIRFFSTDLAGNAEQPRSQQVNVLADTVRPVTTISCNGTSCGTIFRSPVAIVLSATDAGGSGLDKTYYTTNGSTPTTSSTVYVGQFSLTTTTTVRFFSTDKAGNAEALRSQLVTIDSTAPTTTISCNGASCSTGWYRTSPVSVALNATDSGSGVDKTYFTTDGTTPTTSSPVYAASFTVGQTTTVRFFSVDKVGNREAVKSTNIRIDTVAPSVSMTSPTTGQSIRRGTKVTLRATATDAGTGTGVASGIARVVFYLDSTTVLATVTSAPYTATWNTSNITKFAAGVHTITAVATDAAGNATTSAAITITLTA